MEKINIRGLLEKALINPNCKKTSFNLNTQNVIAYEYQGEGVCLVSYSNSIKKINEKYHSLKIEPFDKTHTELIFLGATAQFTIKTKAALKKANIDYTEEFP